MVGASPCLDLLINKSAWDTLPSEYKSMIETASKDATLSMFSKYNFLNQDALIRLIEGGTKFVEYPQEVMIEAQKVSQEIFESNSANNSSFKQIYQQWKTFKENAFNWNNINELSYANFINSNMSK